MQVNAEINLRRLAQLVRRARPGPWEARDLFDHCETWRALERSVVPRLLARRREAPLRIWCTGPRAADDAVAVLLLLSDKIGAASLSGRVRIFATGLDAADVPVDGGWRSGLGLSAQALLEDSFGHGSDAAALHDVLLFGRHDLLTQAPFLHLDLLLCRGGLSALARAHVPLALRRLNFGLEPQGLLVVSEHERHLVAHPDLYQPSGEADTIFRKVGSCPVRSLFPLALVEPRGEPGQPRAYELPPPVEAGRHGHLVLDGSGAVLLADAGARELLALPAQDGRATIGVVLEGVREAVVTGEPIHLRDVEWQLRAEGPARRIDVEIRPAGAAAGTSSAAIVSARHVAWRHAAERRAHEAEASLTLRVEAWRSAEEELRITVEELDRENEQLRTVNQELALSNAALGAEQRMLRLEIEQLNAGLRARSGAGRDEEPSRAIARNGVAERNGDAPAASELTPREREVMALLLDGRQSKEIAYHLGISRRTVDVHRSRLLRKSGARTIADLVRLSIARPGIEY